MYACVCVLVCVCVPVCVCLCVCVCAMPLSCISHTGALHAGVHPLLDVPHASNSHAALLTTQLRQHRGHADQLARLKAVLNVQLVQEGERAKLSLYGGAGWGRGLMGAVAVGPSCRYMGQPVVSTVQRTEPGSSGRG